MKTICLIFAFGLLSLIPAKFLMAQSEEPVQVGEIIMHHIQDNHSWDICTIGEREIALPLPVILFDNGKLVSFFSNRLKDGKVYKGYRLNQEGKIACVDAEGRFTGAMPLDFSITKNVFGMMIICFLIVFIICRNNVKRKGHINTAIEYFLNFLVEDIAKPNIGKHYPAYLNFLACAFLFIFIANLFGLMPFIPGGANITGNIAVTVVLALFAFGFTLKSSTKRYWAHTVNPPVPAWLKIPIPLMPVLELLDVFIKPATLCIRLFANITAGHVIILSLVSIGFVVTQANGLGGGLAMTALSVVFGIFMLLIECLVAFIQAYVFTLLSAIYIGSVKQ